jgi:integrase
MVGPSRFTSSELVGARPSLGRPAGLPDIVLLLATIGLRWGEMAALRVRYIDLGRGRLMVARSATDGDRLRPGEPFRV